MRGEKGEVRCRDDDSLDLTTHGGSSRSKLVCRDLESQEAAYLSFAQVVSSDVEKLREEEAAEVARDQKLLVLWFE